MFIQGVTNTSKIQSESNSQHPAHGRENTARCHQYLKDTIWKQFTTVQALPNRSAMVSPIPQRYNLKAIHNWTAVVSVPLKVSPIPQRYNLKAIHNKYGWFTITAPGVTNTSKIQSESNSQLTISSPFNSIGCHQYLKDTIWKQFTTISDAPRGCKLVSPIPQRYNLKAIHNGAGRRGRRRDGVTNTSKIQSESNSQQVKKNLLTWSGCHQYLKDTIWKQFTTMEGKRKTARLVSPIPQRYNLKAIHNLCIFNYHTRWGVTNTSKIQSESNSQL